MVTVAMRASLFVSIVHIQSEKPLTAIFKLAIFAFQYCSTTRHFTAIHPAALKWRRLSRVVVGETSVSGFGQNANSRGTAPHAAPSTQRGLAAHDTQCS